MRLTFHGKFHTGYKFSPKDVGIHLNTHNFYLFCPYEQQHAQFLQQFKPDDVLRLPIVQDGDELQCSRQHIDPKIIGKNKKNFI